MIAPPIPWAPRARLRKSGELAAPQSAEAIVKRPIAGIGVDHPLQVGEGGVQLLLNLGECDVDDRDVQQEHEDGDTDGDESAPLPVAGRQPKNGRTLLRCYER